MSILASHNRSAKRRNIPWSLFFLWLISLSAYGYTSPVIIDDNNEVTLLTQQLQYLEDTSGKLTIEQISTPKYTKQFIQNTDEILDFGRSRSNYWIRFDIQLNTDKDTYLLIDNPIIGDVDIYIPNSEQSKIVDKEPSNLFSKQNYRTPLFRLMLPKDETFTIYIKAYNGKAILNLPIKLISSEKLLSHTIFQYTFFVAIFAGLMILAIYNFFLYLSLKDNSLIALVAFILAIQMPMFRDSNLFPDLPFFNDPDHYFFSLPMLLTFAAVLHFWRYINDKTDFLLDQICYWVPRLSLLLIPFSGIIFFIEKMIYLNIVVLSPILLILTTRAFFKGNNTILKHSYLAAIVIVVTTQPDMYRQAELIQLDWKGATMMSQAGILSALILLSLTQGSRSRELLIEAEKNKASSKAKDNFLMTMSHELRTPMHAMLASNTLLQKVMTDNTQRNYLEKQQSASKHMMTLINQILDFSSLKNHALTLDSNAFNIDSLAKTLRNLFTVQAQTKGVEFTISAPTRQELTLLGDSTRILQVLINLAGNAIKFTDKGDAIDILIQELDSPEDSATFLFAVTDTGAGIPLDKQPLLFKPFSQLNSTHSRTHGGTGLGLAISHELVSLMGGRLKLRSQTGEGSRFSFTLSFPLAKTTKLIPHLHSNVSNAKTDLSDLKLLLVDDDEINLCLGNALLETLGINTALAHSGKEALKLIKAGHFDMVIMDISMPEMDGYATTRKIREELEQYDLPIIALTAHAFEGMRKKCLDAGMNDYLTKPFNLDELTNIIAKWRHSSNPNHQGTRMK